MFKCAYMYNHSYLLLNAVDHFILHRVQCWAYELNGTVISILTTINANHDTLPVDWTTAMLQYPQDSISGAVTSSWACFHMATYNRFANTWIDGNGTQHRQLTKAYGIRVNINVIGEVSLKILLNHFWKCCMLYNTGWKIWLWKSSFKDRIRHSPTCNCKQTSYTLAFLHVA